MLCYVSKSKLDVQFVKIITRTNIMKGKCKTRYLQFIFKYLHNSYWPNLIYLDVQFVEKPTSHWFSVNNNNNKVEGID